MIRAWIGPEREGYAKGIETIFYEDDIIDCHEVVDLLAKYPQCKRVYLGAGRVRPKQIFNTNELDLYSQATKTEVVIEFDIYSSLVQFIPSSWTTIAVCQVKPTYIKTDDYKTVNVYKLDNPEVTDLADLSEGLFSCDKLIKE